MKISSHAVFENTDIRSPGNWPCFVGSPAAPDALDWEETLAQFFPSLLGSSRELVLPVITTGGNEMLKQSLPRFPLGPPMPVAEVPLKAGYNYTSLLGGHIIATRTAHLVVVY